MRTTGLGRACILQRLGSITSGQSIGRGQACEYGVSLHHRGASDDEVLTCVDATVQLGQGSGVVLVPGAQRGHHDAAVG